MTYRKLYLEYGITIDLLMQLEIEMWITSNLIIDILIWVKNIDDVFISYSHYKWVIIWALERWNQHNMKIAAE